MDTETLFVGIDFGTYKCAVSASNGLQKSVRSLVGWPKDAISMKLIQDPILLGEEALKKRLALDICFPLEKGVIKKESEKHLLAAKELLGHVVESTKLSKKFTRIFGVITSPARASIVHKQTLLKIAEDLFDAVTIISAPFAAAYGLNAIDNTLIVDMGGGTIDLCRMHGAIPDDEDQATLFKGGDYVDKCLLNLLEGKYPDANINIYMAQKYKERFVIGQDNESSSAEFSFNGNVEFRNIHQEIKKAYESIIPEIKSAIYDLIVTYDPGFQDTLKKNILLTGGLSQIKGLSSALENSLQDIECGKIKIADDPVFAASSGALQLARDMPEEYWQSLRVK